jgi:hypothetical protein
MRKMNKTRKYRGGGLGHSYTLTPPLIAGIDNGPGATPQSSCMAAARPGMIPTPQTGLGLPGMGGGGRRSRQGRRRGSQRGGRYSFDLGASTTFGGTPWGSGIPQVVSIPCESSRSNPLNLQMGGVGGIDSASYIAPTAGYTNTPSTWVGSTGSPSMIQTPYDARILNPACLKTGGARRGRKASRSGRKASRRGRKASRRGRKTSRRGRKTSRK